MRLTANRLLTRVASRDGVAPQLQFSWDWGCIAVLGCAVWACLGPVTAGRLKPCNCSAAGPLCGRLVLEGDLCDNHILAAVISMCWQSLTILA